MAVKCDYEMWLLQTKIYSEIDSKICSKVDSKICSEIDSEIDSVILAVPR